MAEFNDLFEREHLASGVFDPIQQDTEAPEITLSVSSDRIVATEASIRAWLQAQDNYTDDPINITNAGALYQRDGFAKPIVGSETLCAQPGGSDTGSSVPSPNAVVCDPYYDVVVTAGETLTLNSGNLTDTLTVSALDRALPYGFAFKFGSEFCQLNAAASAGATSIAIRRMNADCAISSSETAVAANRYTSQAGVMNCIIPRLAVFGDPDPMINPVPATEAGLARKYACDGIAFAGQGHQLGWLNVGNLPGHGIIAMQIGDSVTRAGFYTPWEREVVYLDYATIWHCFSGLTTNVIDGYWNNLDIQGCHDYGAHFLTSSVNSGDKIHAYGCGTAIACEGRVRFNYLEGENSTRGVDLIAGSGGSQIGHIRAYGNSTSAVRVFGDDTSIQSMLIDHAINATYGLEIGNFADHTAIHHAVVNLSSTASGVLLGNSARGADCTMSLLRARVNGGSGGFAGVVIDQPFAGTHLDLTIDGSFTNDFYMSSTGDLAGCTLILRGPSSSTITWPDTTTGTFGTPSIPAGLSSTNTITVLPF